MSNILKSLGPAVAGKILSTCAQHLDPEGARDLGAGWADFFGRLPEGA